MTRFSGKVGYGESQEVPPDSGIIVYVITEYPYFGDVTRNTRAMRDSETLNSDISVGNSISIVADAYARQNFMKIKYVWWNGHPWKVSNVEVQDRRLLLSLDDIYNGPFPEEEV